MAGSPGRVRGVGVAAPVALALLLSAGCGADADDTGSDDIVPPSVVSTSPGPDAEVTPDARVTVVFDEAMDPASIADGISLIGVAGVVEYDAASFAAEFVPDEPLPFGGHTLSIRGVRDIAGNVMTAVYTVNFIVR